jgi:dihydrofolate reductase
MKTIYYTAATLDGFLADDNHYEEFIKKIGALCMGSSTYEWLLHHEVFKEGEPPRPWFYTQPTWVFSSRTLRDVPGGDIRFVKGDVRPVHAEMTKAAGDKDVWIVGGGELAGQFYDAGLLDEIIVSIASVTLGSGMPLLPRRIATPPLKLLSARRHGDGFAVLTYAVPKKT